MVGFELCLCIFSSYFNEPIFFDMCYHGGMDPKQDDTELLLKNAQAGDQTALNNLVDLHRGRLAKMVKTRLNPKIKQRVDQSDVIQESLLEAAKRLPEYLAAPRSPFFLWLRQIVGQKIIDVHRRHLGAEARDAKLEISIDRPAVPVATSICLAAQLLGRLTSPSGVAIRRETEHALQDAINELEPLDREILALRQFEELTNVEAAAELNIEPAAASKRFVRALKRLQEILVRLDLVEINA